jgi:LAO/AO transport system kinase
MAPLIEGVCRGEPRAVARAISMVENGEAGSAELSAGIFHRSGGAATIGLTGAPGAGKSTLAAGLVAAARSRDRVVGVLAVDPSSPRTGGALLGDRLRMQEHATDGRVYIRSMASRGALGGMALAAPEAIRILEAAGADVVIVETVGVGQAEVDVATVVDTTVVVVTSGWGDAVQASKAGLLELADILVVNKADREGASEAVRDLEAMVRGGDGSTWRPPVLRAIAVDGEGVDDLWMAIERHRAHLEASGELDARRERRLRAEVAARVASALERRVDEVLDADPALASALAERRADPYVTARSVLDRMTRPPIEAE